MDILLICLGFLAGGLAAGSVAAVLRARRAAEFAASRELLRQAQEQLAALQGEFTAGQEQLRVAHDQLASLREQLAVAAEREAGAGREAARLAEALSRSEGDFRAARDAMERENVARARVQTELESARKQLDEQRKLLEEAERRLGDTFKALSSEALRSNNQSFLELAKESMQKLVGEAKGDLTRRQEAIDGLVKPVGEALKTFDGRLREMENRWSQSAGQLMEQVTALNQGQLSLRQETGNLVSALRRPEARGRWGEVTLRRVVELSGMSEHCDYSEQVTISGGAGSNADDDSGKLRPDMIVTLPAGRKIVVDSKAPLDAYLSAVAAQTEEERQGFLRQHAQQIRTHVRTLSSKQYWAQLDDTPEFVVLFIPGESFFSAALEQQRTLLEDAWGQRIAIATPTTLIALLRMVAYGWREESLAQSAREVSDLGKELYERLGIFCRHLAEVGSRLESATRSYNSAVGSLESRVLPSARRFEDLKVVEAHADYEKLSPVEVSPRELSSPEAASALRLPPE